MLSKSKTWSVALASLIGGIGFVAACSSTPSGTSNTVNGALDSRAPALTDAAVEPQAPRACTTQAECGAGSYCKGDKALGGSFCAKYTGPSVTGAGQTGAFCDADKGFENPDCDGANSFKCFGVSPSDANATCALYDCKADTDCGPGRFCGAVNTTPSVASITRVPGETVKVCQTTAYCGACVTDIDCAPRGGEAGRCVADEKGASYCTYSCTKDTECALDARCALYADGTSACIPYAGVCKGDGSLCSPCAADSDCTNGECLRAEYSTERYCSQKVAVCTSSSACSAEMSTTKARPNSASVSQGCTDKAGGSIPQNQCIGLVQLGRDNSGKPQLIPGCWTRRRR